MGLWAEWKWESPVGFVYTVRSGGRIRYTMRLRVALFSDGVEWRNECVFLTFANFVLFGREIYFFSTSFGWSAFLSHSFCGCSVITLSTLRRDRLPLCVCKLRVHFVQYCAKCEHDMAIVTIAGFIVSDRAVIRICFGCRLEETLDSLVEIE